MARRDCGCWRRMRTVPGLHGFEHGVFFGLVLETRLGKGGAFMEEQIFPFLPPVEKPPAECVWKMSGLPCCLFWMPVWGKVQRCQFLFFHHRRFPAVALHLSHPCGRRAHPCARRTLRLSSPLKMPSCPRYGFVEKACRFESGAMNLVQVPGSASRLIYGSDLRKVLTAVVAYCSLLRAMQFGVGNTDGTGPTEITAQEINLP